MQHYVGIDISKDSFHFCILKSFSQTITSGNLTGNNIQTFILNPKIVHRFFQFISANNPSKHDQKDDKTPALFALNNPQFLKSYPKNSELPTLSGLIQKLKHELAEAKKTKSNTPFPSSSQKLKNILISTPTPSLTSSFF